MTRKQVSYYLKSSGFSEEQIRTIEHAYACEDAVSRAEAIKAMNDLEQEDIEQYGCHIPEGFDGKRAIEALQSLPSVALSAEPCEDAISRQAVFDVIDDIDKTTCMNEYHVIVDAIDKLPSVNPQPKMGQFAKWVATEIFDDMWEYNKDAFAELACRKLAKLGIVRAKGDKWELVEPQESEDTDEDSD